MTIYEQLREHLANGTKPSDALRADALASAQSSEGSGNGNYPKLVRALIAELDKVSLDVSPKTSEAKLTEFPVENFAKIPDARPKIRVNLSEIEELAHDK